jgi:hypothetical protein
MASRRFFPHILKQPRESIEITSWILSPTNDCQAENA